MVSREKGIPLRMGSELVVMLQYGVPSPPYVPSVPPSLPYTYHIQTYHLTSPLPPLRSYQSIYRPVLLPLLHAPASPR